ncbi:acetyl-CoA carboxylase carboxyltransferase subunit alpha [Clostridium sp. JN-1]|uniref:acetyl-CoA carboxylase carboxyltransferase subunit alpha n=1 Tax=Clostridium sp. JN-1 TaxID=2483110 RepID=UPI000F0BC36F|nr:acetyl-CoA carboxylase carboxyltransferase subunit alpha [Clostridium sp. JN-1]
MEKLEKVHHIMSKFDGKTAWDRVALARMIGRPTALDYIDRIFESFIEFHGDRCFADDPAIVGGAALLEGQPVTIVANQKGRDTKENIKRNFGSAHPEGYRKSLRLMKQAEKFKRPIICFVDTQGAFCGAGAEERGEGEAIAKNLLEMSSLKTPIISIVIGEGGSGGALALAVADKVWMLENAVYSVLSPEGFASILWKDASRSKEAAEVMKITAADLKGYGIIDDIIKEPFGGAHKDVNKMSLSIKKHLIEGISMLKKEPIEEVIEKRYNKFRNMGKYSE